MKNFACTWSRSSGTLGKHKCYYNYSTCSSQCTCIGLTTRWASWQASCSACSKSGWDTSSKATPTKMSATNELNRLLSAKVSLDRVLSRRACTTRLASWSTPTAEGWGGGEVTAHGYWGKMSQGAIMFYRHGKNTMGFRGFTPVVPLAGGASLECTFSNINNSMPLSDTHAYRLYFLSSSQTWAVFQLPAAQSWGHGGPSHSAAGWRAAP